MAMPRKSETMNVTPTIMPASPPVDKPVLSFVLGVAEVTELSAGCVPVAKGLTSVGKPVLSFVLGVAEVTETSEGCVPAAEGLAVVELIVEVVVVKRDKSSC